MYIHTFMIKHLEVSQSIPNIPPYRLERIVTSQTDVDNILIITVYAFVYHVYDLISTYVCIEYLYTYMYINIYIYIHISVSHNI
jgi:hypothetical protein